MNIRYCYYSGIWFAAAMLFLFSMGVQSQEADKTVNIDQMLLNKGASLLKGYTPRVGIPAVETQTPVESQKKFYETVLAQRKPGKGEKTIMAGNYHQVHTMPSHLTNAQYGLAIVNQPLMIWGNVSATNSSWTYTYDLDFGDGTAHATGSVTSSGNPSFHCISASHTYTSTSPQHKTITLIVSDNQGHHDTSTSQIHVLLSATRTDSVNMSIEKGLLDLYRRVTLATVGSSVPAAYWTSSNGYSSPVANTGMACMVFAENGHRPTNAASDPYAIFVRYGLNYILSRAHVVSISPQNGNNPDANANGYGIYFNNNGHYIYETGHGALGLLAAHLTSSTAEVDTIPAGISQASGGSGNLIGGRTYKAVMQDVVDQCAYAQCDPSGGSLRGGWYYNIQDASHGADNSTSQWPALIMLGAQNWGITSPSWVISELSTYWLSASQNANGSFDYTPGTGWFSQAQNGAGILMRYFTGAAVSSTSVVNSLNYLAQNSNWDAASKYNGYYAEMFNGNLYGMYGIKKACSFYGITNVTGSSGSPPPTHNWYQDFIQYLFYNGTYKQKPTGSWPGFCLDPAYADTTLSTGYAIAILTPGVLVAQPVAVIDPTSDQPTNTSFAMTGVDSYHQDPNLQIVSYKWDFGGNGPASFWPADATGMNVTNPGYSSVGDYTVSLIVYDNNGDSATTTYVVHITTANHPPVAIAIPPPALEYTGRIGQLVLLDGRSSYSPDPGINITTWDWDTDGNTTWDSNGDTLSVVHYTEYSGIVGLRVHDSHSPTSLTSNTATARLIVSGKNIYVSSFYASGTSSDFHVHAVLNNDATSNAAVNDVLVRFYDGNPLTTGQRITTIPDQFVDLPVGNSATIDLTGINYSSLDKTEPIYVYLDADNSVEEWDKFDNFMAYDWRPIITQQPTAQNFCDGSNAIFTAGTDGYPSPTYQWQVNTGSSFVDVTNTAPYSGATTATLTITAASASMSGYQYQCLFQNSKGDTATNAVALTIIYPPAITTPPSNSSIAIGDNTSFSVTATGDGLIYQWQVDDGSGWGNVTNTAPYSGANTATLSITNATYGMSGYLYKCIVTGTCSPAATSASATLTVSPPLTATITGTTSICSGSSTNLSIDFDGTAPFVYSLNNGTPVTTSSDPDIVSVSPTTTTGYYITSLSDANYSAQAADYAGTVTVTVLQRPNAPSSSGNPAICANQSIPTLSVSVGYPSTADWYSMASGGILLQSGSTSYTPTAAGTFYAQSRDLQTGCVSLTRTGVTLTINPRPIAELSGTATICRGNSTDLTVTVTGGSTGPWSGSLNDGVTTFSGKTANPFTIGVSPTTATSYQLATLSDDNTTCPATSGDLTGTATVTVSSVTVSAKVYLEGPWDGSTGMYTFLNPYYLPLSQPYNTSPWNYAGSESVTSIPNTSIEDWILVELYTGTIPTNLTRVARRAGFIKSDGNIVDLNGTSPLEFSTASTGSYYLAVKHRNHLAIYSTSAQTVNCNSSLYNFTSSQSQAYTSSSLINPMIYLAANKYGMIAGDATGDGSIDAPDWNIWDNMNGVLGYYGSDMNHDTSVDTFDVNTYWYAHNGSSTQVP